MLPYKNDIFHRLSSLVENGCMNRSAIIDFLRELAHEAGAIMLERRGSPLQTYRKSDRSLVTETDLAISTLVQRRVAAFAPNWSLLTEESGGGLRQPHGDEGLIVDELDGTNAYAHGLEGFTFQCAYYRQRKLQIGLIYDPLGDRLLYAKHDKGVWLETEGRSIPVAMPEYRRWRELRFAHHRQYMTNTIRKMYALMGIADRNIIPTGGIGSKCLDFVTGKVDVVVALNRRIAPWDWAPGKVILEELGYSFTHLTGAAVHLYGTPAPQAFGYLVCPPEHRGRFLRELAWITEKVTPTPGYRQLLTDRLREPALRGNLSA